MVDAHPARDRADAILRFWVGQEPLAAGDDERRLHAALGVLIHTDLDRIATALETIASCVRGGNGSRSFETSGTTTTYTVEP